MEAEFIQRRQAVERQRGGCYMQKHFSSSLRKTPWDPCAGVPEGQQIVHKKGAVKGVVS
jgi:hypothetical protein